MADDNEIKKIGELIAAGGKERTSWEIIEANLDRLSKHFANTLPDDVTFVLVLGKKGELDANQVATDLETAEAIQRLAKVRDQLRNGGIRMAWSKDQEIRDSRIVRVN